MKKQNFDLAKTLEAAKSHSETQVAGLKLAKARTSKTELMERTEQSLKTRSAPTPAKPKAKPIRRVQSIRDNISYSQDDADRIQRLMTKAARGGVLPNKSEVIRAGLLKLDQLSESELTKVLKSVPRLKPGRQQLTKAET